MFFSITFSHYWNQRIGEIFCLKKIFIFYFVRISLAATNNQFRNVVKFFVCVNKVLAISRHSKISPASFMFLTENATNLRTLRLVSCAWINDKLLKPVLHNNVKLTTVDISDCENFTEGILQVE